MGIWRGFLVGLSWRGAILQKVGFVKKGGTIQVKMMVVVILPNNKKQWSCEFKYAAKNAPFVKYQRFSVSAR